MNADPIALFPLETVLFPDGYLPLQIFEVRYLDMIKRAIADGRGFGVVSLAAGAEVRRPGQTESLAAVGTIATIRASTAPMAGLMQIECIGTTRFSISSSECLRNGLWVAQVQPLAADRSIAVPDELSDVAEALGSLIQTLQDEHVEPGAMPIQAPFLLDQCGWVANRWAELLPMPVAQKLRLLELDNPLLRLELVQDLLHEHGVL
jgi:Lon protease-like protein